MKHVNITSIWIINFTAIDIRTMKELNTILPQDRGKPLTEAQAEYIKLHFKYDPETGKITRSDRKGGNGSIDRQGYLILKIKGEQFKAHRIAWFLYYGQMPDKTIDHINGIRSDNRIANLRDVTDNENAINRHNINRDTGCVGIHIDTYTKGLKSRYTTQIKKGNKKIMGRFETIEEAKKWRVNNGYRV